MAEYIPRGIREIVWKNKDKTKSTRYRIRIEKAGFTCDRSFELLPDAVEFLALTKVPEGRLAIAEGRDTVTLRERIIHEAVADAIQNSPVTLEDAIHGYIRVYLQGKLDSGVDKDVRSAKVNRGRLLHSMTIEVGYIKPGYAVPSGGFAKLREQSKGFTKRPIGEFRIVDLTEQETTEYINARLSGKIAKSTIKREIGAMQSCINHLMHTDNRAWKAIGGYNPFAKADRNLVKGGIKRRRRVMTDEEEEVLLRELRACRNKEMPIIFAVSLATSLRRAETLSLIWSQINLEGGYIDLEPNQAKSGEERLLMLSKEACSAINTLPRTDERVFHYSIEGFKSVFARVVKRSGMQNFGFHDVRRTFVSRMLRDVTGSSTAIADRMGMRSARSIDESLVKPLKRAEMVKRGPQTQEEIMALSGHSSTEIQSNYTNIAGLGKIGGEKKTT